MKDLNLDEKKIRRAYQQTVEQMCRLNRNAAELARKYHAHASTDVTGFGLIGTTTNLSFYWLKHYAFFYLVCDPAFSLFI